MFIIINYNDDGDDFKKEMTPAETPVPKFKADNSILLVGIKWLSLERTVVGDWRFDNLCRSHLQSQVKSSCQSMML